MMLSMVSANFPAGVAWNAKIIARRGRLDFRIEYHAIAAEHEISLAANEREYTRIRRLTFAFIRVHSRPETICLRPRFLLPAYPRTSNRSPACRPYRFERKL